ncbi:putative phosphoinositide 3-kinase [Diplodia seriata]|uniref:Phosphatidylinositol 3-kinase VPS34 n=1 Tax=Diplodia seriata TaxID=420778 RepID=A0A0G2H3A7_9PEZI|nr:putative phosphoinositide 3-kinase [Diplodia seriata]
MEPFSFASSSALELPVHVRINNLDGHQNPIAFSTLLKHPELRHRGSNLRQASRHPGLELCIKPLTVPVQTSYKSFKSSRTWNEWLTLPISYETIPQSSLLAITVWDLSPTENSQIHAAPFGGTTIPLFDKDNTLQKGRQRCRIHLQKAADGLSSSTTPHLIPPRRRNRRNGKLAEEADPDMTEMERLEVLMKKHEMGEIPENRWLDQMVFRKMEQLERSTYRSGPKYGRKTHAPKPDGEEDEEGSDEESLDEDKFFIYVEFPRFDHPIVFTDREYPAPPVSTMQQSSSIGDVRLKPPPEVSFGPGINGGVNDDDPEIGRLIRIYDPEVGIRDNPAESKHRRLVRNHRTGVMDRDMKPNAKARDELNVIMSYGPTHELSSDDKDMVWKFRHHLTRDKRALTKFVKSVSWHEPGEARQAVQLLSKWTDIDVDDALEILGPMFDHPAVRSFAVDRLRKADDGELQLYLLQLVQALKFEPVETDSEGEPTQHSSLARFLINRASGNLRLGTFFHWYLMVECDDRSPEQGTEHRKLFAKVEYDFMTTLMEAEDGPAKRKVLLRQGELITVLSKISKEIRFSRDGRPQKIESLKQFLADPKNDLMNIDPPLPLPLDPTVEVVSVFPDDCNVFKSSLFPLLINFKTTTGAKYPVIFKTGDDLRQDQLVIQIITLMDRLLRLENLDLKLSPYRILATSTTAGAVQFVPSTPLAAAVTKYRGQDSILSYLRANNPDDSSPLGVRKEAMDTYVKSCAGYCVITYLLGVGDRHLDNLLLAPDGHFFHADFGYILGRDPKPFAPLMKLDNLMIAGMGGPQHDNFTAFKNYCFTAYTTLRKQSSLILNLFSLMRDANIPDIKIERDKAVWKVQERMCLDLTEEEAIRHFEGLISDSLNAVMPLVIDRLHGLVQNWRA